MKKLYAFNLLFSFLFVTSCNLYSTVPVADRCKDNGTAICWKDGYCHPPLTGFPCVTVRPDYGTGETCSVYYNC